MVIRVLGQYVVDFPEFEKIKLRDPDPCLQAPQDVDRRVIRSLSPYRFFFGVDVVLV